MDPGISDFSTHGARVARRDSVLTKACRRLARRDRQLLALWQAHQLSQRHLADAIGCHHATLYRRIRRLRTRVTSRAALALTLRGRQLPVLTYTIAMRRHLLGHPVSAIARDLALSRPRVHQVLAEFAGWLSAQRLHEGDQS